MSVRGAGWLLLALSVAACNDRRRDDDDPPDDDDSGDDDAGDDDGTGDDDATGDDDSAGDDDTGDDDAGDDDTEGDDDAGDDDTTPPPPTFDCLAAPSTFVSQTVLPGARGYHGLAIDGLGIVVGSDGSSLIRSNYTGTWYVFLPGVGYGQQMDYLPNGDLVWSADDGAIRRITPGGGSSTVLGNVYAYGVKVGPDGMIYVAGNGTVSRIDPSTGARTTLATLAEDEPHSLDFSPDYSRLYIGTIAWADEGRVYKIELGATLNPTGPATIFAQIPDSGWFDGVAVDACGYLYVPDYWSSRMYRISPTGAWNIFVDWSADSSGYGHGAVWGNGVGGWRQDAIYVPLPYLNNQVKEVVVGVPSRMWSGVVLNAP